MTKWLTSLVLIMALGSSVLAGRPAHMDEHGTMSGMRCCRLAEMQRDAPEVRSAKLCCLVNCPQPGQTGTTTTAQNVSPQVIIKLHPAHLQSAVSPQDARLYGTSNCAAFSESQPTYIRHSALLI